LKDRKNMHQSEIALEKKDDNKGVLSFGGMIVPTSSGKGL
jgi:hypothetical protein